MDRAKKGKNDAQKKGGLMVRNPCSFSGLGMQLFRLQLEASAYSGAFLLTVDYFSLSTYNWSLFCLQF